MSIIGPRTTPTRRDTLPGSRPPGMARKVLLACGILGALIYAVVPDLLATILYASYSPFSQAISELSAIGAPTRGPALIAATAISNALFIPFGIGVWQSAQGERTLRVTGGLLIAYGAMWPLWLPYPTQLRENINETSALTDLMHSILGAVTILVMLAAIGFAAAALGKRFRLYSILTVATVLVFGALTFTFVPELDAGDPTPWLGVVSRINMGAWLLWVVFEIS